MDIPAVASRYAQAFYDLTVEENVADAVRIDLATIRELIGHTADFADFLENPTITPKVAEKTVAALFHEKVHPATLLFIRFLAARGRLSQLRAVCDAYEQRICRDKGILRVRIIAAHELTGEQLSAMKQKLHAQYGKTIEAEVQIDPSLIGGFKVQVGDLIRDFSLVSKLDQFEQSVMYAEHEHHKLKV